MNTTMFVDTLPISILINNLKNEKPDLDFNDLKIELTKKNENNEPYYNLSLKEDDTLCLLYTNNSDDNKLTELEQSCRSVILEKSSLKLISSQYDKILYNEETLDFINKNNVSINQIVIQKCYEGTLLLVFNVNDKWYVSTRRCLNARQSVWANNKSYYDMFSEAMNNKFTFDDLNKDYCYQFVLVHYLNKNIVNYDYLGQEYKELYHIMTTKKYSLEEVDVSINSSVKYVQNQKFNNFEELLNEIDKVNDYDTNNKKVTLEGYVLRYYPSELYKGPYKLLKLQTELYSSLMKLKPNNNNIYQCYLELYQKNSLSKFIQYFSNYPGEVIKRLRNSMQTLSNELLTLYHCTRNKKSPELYDKLHPCYKKVLYELHGMYIKNQKLQLNNQTLDNQSSINKGQPINVFDVYHYLKQINPYYLRQLFYERHNIIKSGKTGEYLFINCQCIDITTLSTLMFK